MIPEKLTYEELEQRVKKLENEAVGHKWMEMWVKAQRDLLVSLAAASSLEQSLGFCLDAAIILLVSLPCQKCFLRLNQQVL